MSEAAQRRGAEDAEKRRGRERTELFFSADLCGLCVSALPLAVAVCSSAHQGALVSAGLRQEVRAVAGKIDELIIELNP